jgi:hypothetical protein
LFLSGDDKTFGRFYVYLFVQRSISEGCFHVELDHLEVFCSSYGQHQAERVIFDYGCIGFGVIQSKYVRVSFNDKTGFVGENGVNVDKIFLFAIFLVVFTFC